MHYYYAYAKYRLHRHVQRGRAFQRRRGPSRHDPPSRHRHLEAGHHLLPNRNVAPVGVVGSLSSKTGQFPEHQSCWPGPLAKGSARSAAKIPSTRETSSPSPSPYGPSIAAQTSSSWEQAPLPALAAVAGFARRLEALGHTIQTWELDAIDHGTPQLRRRSFTLASRIGPVPHPTAHAERRTVGQVFANPVPADDPMHVWPLPKGIAAKRIALVPPRGDKRDLMRLAPHLCPDSLVKVGCQATNILGPHRPGSSCQHHPLRIPEPLEGALSPSHGEPDHLAPREGARLQGVPDHWQFVGEPYPVARQIGNGVPITSRVRSRLQHPPSA